MRGDMEAVATAAIAWNRARMQRIAAAKVVPAGAIGYSAEEHRLRIAKKAEAQAKAYLRKVCTKADPSCLVLNAEVHASNQRLPAPDVIDI